MGDFLFNLLLECGEILSGCKALYPLHMEGHHWCC